MWDTASKQVFRSKSDGTGLLLVSGLLASVHAWVSLLPVHHDKYGYLRKDGLIPHLAVAVFVVACMSKAGMWWPLALPKITVTPSAF